MYKAIAMGAALVLTTTVAVRQTILGLVDIPPLHSKTTESPAKTTEMSAARMVKREPIRPPAPAIRPLEQPGLSFDVVSVDPQGTSVFAGQAPINSSVSIQANGRELARTTADETGAWALATERKLAPGEYEFRLSAQAPQQDEIVGPSVRLAVASPSPPAGAGAQADATASQSPQAPITFLYDDTTFTTEGRRAADLLAKRLVAQRPAIVSLSGHADERGSDQYNMELSRRRLTVVADYLRENGFVGKLELIPKGRTVPYTAVDRQAIAKEDLFQLDRRVELLRAR